MNANISVLGLYNYDTSIFANMAFPTGFSAQDKTDFVDNLLMDLAELEVIYPDPVFFKMAVEKWSKKELPTWNRIYTAAQLEYNPIENYDRQESETEVTDGSRQHSGTDTITNSGKDTTQDSGTDSSTGTGSRTTNNTGTDTTTNNIAAYDTNTLVTHDTSALLHGHSISDSTSDSTSVTHGKKSELTHGHVEATQHGEKIDDDITRNKMSRIHGNIGVTTSQQMLTQEIEVAPKLNIMNYMIESFKNRFCVLVW